MAREKRRFQMSRKPFILAGLMLIGLSTLLSALEIKEGRVKLVLTEDTGRFSLYYLSDVKKNTYVPLIFDSDPRTSVITALVDNRDYRLGEDLNFRNVIVKSDSGAGFRFSSPTIAINEIFTFIRSSGEDLANGVRISIDVENLSDKPQKLGLRFLTDTYLGEKSGKHFSTDVRKSITNELALTRLDTDSYLVSPGGQGVSFQWMIGGSGITRPDLVVFANWKRLIDSAWTYTVNPGRDFSLLPYSINDSAAAFYFNPVTVEPGGKRTFDLAMGQFTEKGFAALPQENSSASKLFQTAINAASLSNDKQVSVQTDLISIRDLIDQLDRKLDSKEPLSKDDLQIFRQVLDELKKRQHNY
jgi:hypothetical protein